MTWPHLWEAECEFSSAFSHHGFSGVQWIDRLTMPKSAQLDRGAFSWVIIILLSHFINSLSCFLELLGPAPWSPSEGLCFVS